VRLVWSARADRDFSSIVDYIAQDNAFAAIEQGDNIQDAIEHLKQHPKMGRIGRVKGTRELIVAPTPYIVIYREHQVDTIEIVRVLHGAQQWPPA
jgi:toxin ParE1/3/4